MNIINRPNRLSILALIGMIVLGANLFHMQIIKGAYYRSLSEKNRLRVIYLEAARGKIFDRNKKTLATSRLSFNCSAIPKEAKAQLDQSCQILGEILGEDPEVLEQRFYKKKPGAFRSVVIAEDIGLTQAVEIEERLDVLPGFMVETRPQREYPYKDSLAHVTGFIGPMTEEEEEEATEIYGYSLADWVGRDGIEKNYESYLRGFSGGLQIEVDSRGRMMRPMGVREPKEGKDIQLTVDADLQRYTQALLESRKGAVFVMELKEGGILALNSSPSFDPNLFASKRGRKEVGKYLKGEDAPMINRAIRGQYPPGSIFKIVTALAALDSHKMTSSTSVDCLGLFLLGSSRFHCWKEEGHGPQSLTQAFAHSCNVYFYTAGVNAGLEAIVNKALALGFYRLTGVDLPGERKGFVPSRQWKRNRRHEAWFEGETANLAIGQGYLQVTPAQALVMIAAAATDGQIFKPHLIDKIDGIKVAETQNKKTAIPDSYWKAVKNGLDAVVNSDSGTGRLARAPGVPIAGKTGTAQSGQDKTHAWFVGYAPVENPKIAMVVFLENGGRGGIAAAKVASALFEKLHEFHYV